MTSTGDGVRKALADELAKADMAPMTKWGDMQPLSNKAPAAMFHLTTADRDLIVAALRAPSSGTVTREEVARALFDHNDKKYIHHSKWDDANSYVKDQWLELADVALSLPPPVVELRRWRHKKRGSTYTEVGRGNMQTAAETSLEDMEPVVVYRSDTDGSIWVRSISEFEDGRFEALASLPAKSMGDVK